MRGLKITAMSGVEGRVTFPDIGALIGYFSHWQLALDERSSTYTLRASFGYLNPALWAMTDRPKQIMLEIGKGARYRVEQDEGGKTEQTGKDLMMERITLWPEER